MMTFFTLWTILLTATLGLALYRKFVAMHEENYLHLGEGERAQIPGQFAMARRMSIIDQ